MPDEDMQKNPGDPDRTLANLHSPQTGIAMCSILRSSDSFLRFRLSRGQIHGCSRTSENGAREKVQRQPLSRSSELSLDFHSKTRKAKELEKSGSLVSRGRPSATSCLAAAPTDVPLCPGCRISHDPRPYVRVLSCGSVTGKKVKQNPQIPTNLQNHQTQLQSSRLNLISPGLRNLSTTTNSVDGTPPFQYSGGPLSLYHVDGRSQLNPGGQQGQFPPARPYGLPLQRVPSPRNFFFGRPSQSDSSSGGPPPRFIHGQTSSTDQQGQPPLSARLPQSFNQVGFANRPPFQPLSGAASNDLRLPNRGLLQRNNSVGGITTSPRFSHPNFPLGQRQQQQKNGLNYQSRLQFSVDKMVDTDVNQLHRPLSSASLKIDDNDKFNSAFDASSCENDKESEDGEIDEEQQSINNDAFIDIKNYDLELMNSARNNYEIQKKIEFKSLSSKMTDIKLSDFESSAMKVHPLNNQMQRRFKKLKDTHTSLPEVSINKMKENLETAEMQNAENDSGVDETMQQREGPRTNGISELSKQSPDNNKRSSRAGSPVKSPSKSIKILPRTPDAAPLTTVQDKKKVPMNKVQVGAAPSPNLKSVRSKIGSLDNSTYKPGGGKVKIENRKLDFSKAQPKIAAKNDKYIPSGGDKKIQQVKLQWNAKPKIGSLDNAAYKPGGGDKKIETVKLDFKDKAKSKVGSKENAKHVPGGGSVKIETQKIEIKAESKIGSLENVKHKPGGGDKKIFDDKTYLRQNSSNVGSISGSGSQSPIASGTGIDKNGLPISDKNLNQEY
ncbi:PREDICTED: uncharacterized protein LOC105366194 [Ceratosolen solmsi marchali]|uniref:Microtubule-associated protein n=1 Tax=Ceratosolen solmsi marchali TaxID=326594 RepID=A0AAJ7E070_9HYME|nr:PREDICTED: uncharacterized protein LOC105366194 [Ceratosolen solmsi marchali]